MLHIKGYEIREQIGEGGFAAIYRAFQPIIEREVAIKVIRPKYANRPEFIRDFEAEARLVARLEHPHIVPLFDYWRDPDGAYLVMRWLRGGNLSEFLKQGPLPLEQASRWLDQIAGGLAVAHRNGVVHRDIKPANIVLDEEGNAYLTDFGLAILADTKPERDEAVSGSIPYMSPEQFLSKKATPQSDVYSLGIILYEMLTGIYPFGDLTNMSVRTMVANHLNEPLPDLTNLPQDINLVIQKATAKEPENRYQDVQTMALEFRRYISGHTVVEVDDADLINPYKGLRPFEEADANDFFGREALTQQLLDLLREDDPFRRFLSLVGPSGSGKSSVVFAGLVPALRRGDIDGSENWFIVEFVPGSHPLQHLEAALLSVAASPPADLLEQLQSDPQGLLRAADNLLSEIGADAELFIIIDQFEEVFTLVEDEAERAHFLGLIQEAVLSADSRIRIITTLRADFYHKPLLYEGFGMLMQQRTQTILPLTTEELEQAVTAPARRAGLAVDTDLVAAVIADVHEEPGVLPLLQYALTEVFEGREGRHLTLSAYRDSGGVLGALARRAETVYQSLDRAQQMIARQVLIRLVSLGEGTEDTRRRTPLSELASIVPDHAVLQGVLDAFGKYRLLTFDQEPGTREPMVELAHEALIREWGELGAYLDERRDDIRQQRLLANMASEWQQSGEDSSYLLHGARLQQFEDWIDEGAVSLSEGEQHFLTISIDWKEQQEARDRARHERELALEKRAFNRLRLAVSVLLIGIVIAIGLSVFAFRERSAAEDAREVSEANADLAQQNLLETWKTQALFRADISQRQLEQGSPQAALLIALEAADNYPTVFAPEMHTVLHNALFNPLQEVAHYPHPRAEEGQLGAIWNQDDTLLLTWSVDGNARLWEDGAQPNLIFAHDRKLNGAMFSGDETQILTWSEDGTVKVWDAADGSERHQFDVGDLVQGARWNSSEQKILAWTLNGIVQVWDIQDQVVEMEWQHQGLVRGATWNKDESAILSWSDDGTALLWDADGVIKRYTHIGAILGAAWSRDEDQVLTWSADNTVRLWHPDSDLVAHTLNHDGLVVGARWSRDETQILSWSEDATVRIWDVSSGEEVAVLPHNGRMKGAIFNHDETQVLSWTELGAVYVWNIDNVDEPLIFEVETGNVTVIEGAAWNADETKILSWSQNGNLHILNTQNPDEPPLVIAIGPAEPIWFAFWIRDETQITTVGSDGSVRVWTTNYEPLEHVLRHDDFVSGAVWNQDNTQVLTWSSDSTAQIRDLTGQETAIILDHESAVLGAAWNQDESRLLTWTSDGSVFDWDLATQQPLTYAHDGSVFGARRNADERLILSWSQDNTARLWGAETAFVLEHDAPVFGAEWNDGESRILTWSEDGTARLWEVDTGELVLPLSHEGSVGGAYWIDADQKVLTWTKQGIISVWDAQSGDVILTMRHDDVMKGAALTRAQTRLLSWSNDRTIRLWNLEDGALIAQLDYGVPINGAVWNADESLVLAWEEGSGTWGTGRAFVWNPESGEMLFNAVHDLRPIRGARWSPDETEILTWSWDSTVTIWDVSGEREPIILVHDPQGIFFEDGVWGAVWSADGTRVLSLPSDGTARIFIVDMDELIRVAEEHVIRPLYEFERALAFLPPEVADEEVVVTEEAAPIPTSVPLLLESTIVPTPLPQATPTAQMASHQGQITDQVVVYSGADNTFPVVTSLEGDAPLEILAEDGAWFYVKAGESYGWVAREAVDYSGSLSDLPDLEEIGVQQCELPADEFASTWAKINWQLGCPVSELTSILSTAQPYVNGIMTWRSDTRNIFVILNDGRWAQYDDTWRPGEQLTCSSYYTALGFGKVYCNNPEVQALLGPPTGPERIATLRVQNFQHGAILESLNIGRLTLLDERELVYEK